MAAASSACLASFGSLRGEVLHSVSLCFEMVCSVALTLPA